MKILNYGKPIAHIINQYSRKNNLYSNKFTKWTAYPFPSCWIFSSSHKFFEKSFSSTPLYMPQFFFKLEKLPFFNLNCIVFLNNYPIHPYVKIWKTNRNFLIAANSYAVLHICTWHGLKHFFFSLELLIVLNRFYVHCFI